MFGFRSAVPSQAHRSLLDADNALAQQSAMHPDGWGIGWFVDDEAYVVRTAHMARDCHRFQRTSAQLTSHTFVVHVRRATVGVVDQLNAHPFRHGRWLMAHNGTVFGMEQLGPWMAARTDSKSQTLILGDTDSEQLFYYLLTALSSAGVDTTGRTPAEANLVAATIRAALLALDQAAITMGCQRPLVNVLLTDGRMLIGHKAGMPLFLSSQKTFCADFATCPEPNKACMEPTRPVDQPVNHLLLASEPIGRHENIWEDISDGSTVVLSEDFRMTLLPPPAGWAQPPFPEEYRVSPRPTLAG